jgi:hypothetical protein
MRLTRVAIRFFTFTFFDEVAKATRARSAPGRVFVRRGQHLARLRNAIQHGCTRQPALEDSHGIIHRFDSKAGARQLIRIVSLQLLDLVASAQDLGRISGRRKEYSLSLGMVSS